MICALSSRSSRGLTAFTLPCVPTGINAGVSITPCVVASRPRRARDERLLVINSNIAGHVRDRRKCRKRIRFGERTRLACWGARPALAKFSFDSCRKFIELFTGKLHFGEPPEPVREPRALPRSARKKFFAASDFPPIFASSASDV